MKKQSCMIVGVICVFALFPFAVFLNQPISEDEDMVKYGQFAEITVHADNVIKNISSIQNIAEYGGTYFWCTIDNDTLTMHSSSDFTADDTVEETITCSYTAGVLSGVACRRFNSDDIYGVSCVSDGSDVYMVWIYSTDGGSTWNTSEVSYSTIYTAFSAIDICYANSVIHIMTSCLDPVSNINYRFFSIAAALILTIDTGSGSSNCLPGATYADGYWFGDQRSTTLNFVTFTAVGAMFTDQGSATVPAITNDDIDHQYLIKRGNHILVVSKDYMGITYGDLVSGGATPIAVKTASNTATTGLVSSIDSNNFYQPEFSLFDNILWKILPSGAPVKIQDWTTDAYCGMDNWFSTGSAVYQYSLTTFFESQTVQIRSALYTPYSAQIINITDPDTDQYLILTDDSDRPIFQGYVTEYESNNVDVKWTLRDPSEIDFNRAVTVSFTDKTAHYILKYIIDTYCLFLWYDSGIDTTPATTYSPAFTDKTVLDIIRWCDATESYQTSIRPTHEVYWDEYSDAESHAVVDTTDAITSNVEILKNSQRFGRFLVYGGFLNGVRLVGEVLSDPLLDTFIDEFPNLTTQALVDAQAAKFAATKNLSIAKLRFTVVHNMIYTGQEVALTFTEYSIAAEQWYVIESNYDAVLGVNRLILTNAYWQPPAEDQ